MSMVELVEYKGWLPRAQMPKSWVSVAHVTLIRPVLDEDDRPIDRTVVSLLCGHNVEVVGAADDVADQIARAMCPVSEFSA